MGEKSESTKKMSACDVETLRKCLEENKGDYVKCQAHIEAFKSSCSLKKSVSPPQSAQKEAQRNLDAEIEALLNVEKQTRLAGDVAGTKKAVTDILQLCFEARAWKTLNEQIVLLSKRRGQL